MSDVDHERLAIPAAHSIFSQHTASGSYTGTTTLTGASAAPPFAPHPQYGQQPQHHHLHSQHALSGSGGTAPSSRSGATSALTDPPGGSSSSSECNIHEVCYYFQQAVFILAIMTGVALVIAGTVIHMQSGELLVFVYIGVLLAGVNTVLLMIQCCVRRKQKRRSRAYQTNRQAHASTQSSAVHYNPLTPNAAAPQSVGKQSAPSGGDVQQYHYKHYHMHSPTVSQPMFKDFPAQQGIFAQSPTESQSRYLHAAPYHRSGSIVSHHKHAKGMYQKSPPLGQSHRALLNPCGPQLPSARCDESYSPSAPPPSYDDLLRSGRLPQEGTTVHLI